MKNLILILLLFFSIPLFGQLGAYSPTVTSTETPVGPHNNGDIVQYCVTVSNFTECSAAWFDGLEIVLTGANLISYDSSPNANWKTDLQSNDEPAGWIGFSFNAWNPPNQTWNDFGESNATSGGTWTFCFSVQITGSYSVDVNLWSDYDTGGYGSGCGTQGIPDGPYNLSNSVLPVDFIDFDVTCNKFIWFTATEINNDYFTLYHSFNGYDWNYYREYPGNGNSNTPIMYEFYDEVKPKGYFKLTQTDFNGKETELSIKFINCVKYIPETLESVWSIDGKFIGNKYPTKSGIYILKYKNFPTIIRGIIKN